MDTEQPQDDRSLTRIVHNGKGKAVFNSEGTVQMHGYVQIESWATGGCSIVFAVTKMTIPPAPDEGNTLIFPFEIQSFVINTTEGTYHFDEGVTVKEVHDEEENFLQVLILSANIFSFVVDGAEPAIFWRLPLINFVSSFDKVVDDATEQLDADTYRLLIALNGGILGGGIQQLPNYTEKVTKLKEGLTRREITAVMVGRTESVSTDLEQCRALFLNGILPLLSFTNGFEVGTSWIEFLDKDGRLKIRQHVNWTAESYNRGHAVIGDRGHRLLGQILNSAMKSDHWGKVYFRVCLLRLLRTESTYLTAEDRLSHLFRVLDLLCEHFKLFEVETSKIFTPLIQSSVKKIAKNAGKQIVTLSKQPSAGVDVIRLLHKIESQIHNAKGIRRNFGEAVELLIQKHDFVDHQILKTYFEEHPREDKKQWKQVVPYYRGIVMHRGYFEFETRDERRDQIAITEHLYDCAIRIILRMIGYQGEYRSPIGNKIRDVNWVTAQTSPEDLGFGVLPLMDRPGVKDALIREIEDQIRQQEGNLDDLNPTDSDI